MKKFTKETYINWYKDMLFWRKFEDKLAALYIQQKVRGFLHLYNGQEAVLAGALHVMKENDKMITAYRNHVQPIGLGVDPKRVMAELLGKVTGTSKGMGGSMHVFSPEHNFYGGHGIVGGQIPLGAGLAFGSPAHSQTNQIQTQQSFKQENKMGGLGDVKLGMSIEDVKSKFPNGKFYYLNEQKTIEVNNYNPNVNFQQNFYMQNIKVIDPEIESNVIPKVISSKLDAQFLPEGGHLLANTENTVGVVIKDELGFGIPNLECQLISGNDEIINFKTNQFGIGKFMFIPVDGKNYRVSVNFEGTKQIFNIDSAELSGVTFSLGDLHDKVVLRIATNKSTLSIIQNKPIDS